MRVAVLRGDHSKDLLQVLRTCGHEAVEVVDATGALASARGVHAPRVVATYLSTEPREPLIRSLRTAGAWVIGAAEEAHLDALRACDDLLPLPASSASVQARLLFAERRAREEAIAATFFDRNPSPMWIYDAETREILSVNDAAIARYGWSRPDFLRLKLEDLRPPEDVDRFLAEYARQKSQPLSLENITFRHRTKSGEILEVEVHGAGVEHRGRPARMVLIRDVTVRNRMQMTLVLSDRLTTVGTLASGVAHEINNPLAVALANIDFALGELKAAARPEDAETMQALEEGRVGAERVRNIVRDLHVFARAETDKKRALQVEKVAELALAMAANELRHRARVVKSFEEVPPVLANEQQLGQVILNLLVNAAHAIEPGNVAGNEVRVSIALEDDRVAIEVRDSGSGIPADVLPRVFDPFFTTKEPGEGTGLGLSICHSIVASMEGEIRVDSTVGKGTAFRVLLPPAAKGARRKTEPIPAGTVAVRRARVLLVDDEPLIGRTVSRILAADHDVTVAGSAREALAQIESGTHFDVILCDLMMPEMTGMDLHAELGRRSRQIQERMIFVTGGAFTPEAQRFLDTTAQPWIAKPFDAAQLKALIASRLS